MVMPNLSLSLSLCLFHSLFLSLTIIVSISTIPKLYGVKATGIQKSFSLFLPLSLFMSHRIFLSLLFSLFLSLALTFIKADKINLSHSHSLTKSYELQASPLPSHNGFHTDPPGGRRVSPATLSGIDKLAMTR